jgi:hypothetical protein
MNITEIMKRVTEPYVRSFCLKIESHCNHGDAFLLPSRLYAEGSVYGTSMIPLRSRDRKLAPGLLQATEQLRLEHPELAAEFLSVLWKAERVWRGCLAV